MTARLPAVRPAEMSAEQRALYERYTGGVRAANTSSLRLVDGGTGELLGPPGLWLHHYPLGDALERLGGVVRFQLQLPAAAAEVAILRVAQRYSCAFELHAHRRAARAAGLTDAQVASLADGARPAGLDETHAAVVELADELLDTGRLSEPSFVAGRDRLGETQLLELVTLVGYYVMLALQLNAFAVVPASSEGSE